MYQQVPSNDKGDEQFNAQPPAAYVPHQQYSQHPQYAPQQPQYHQQYQTAQAPIYATQVAAAPYAVVFAPPPRRGSIERYLTRFGHALLLMLINFINLFFSIGMFTIVILGVTLTMGLLPVACLGLIFLNILICFVRPIAALDGWLYRQRQNLYDSLQDDY